MRKMFAAILAVALSGGGHASIIFRAEPPSGVPTSVPMVQVVATPVSRDMLQRRAAQFGITGNMQFLKTPVGLAIQAGPMLVQTNSFGSDFYADLSKYAIPQPTTGGPISDTAAIGRAQDFAAKYFPLVGREGTVQRVQHLMSQAQDLSTGQLLPASQDESIVLFQRKFAGIPVIGPGDMGRLHVANTGEVTGAQVLWRRLKNLGGKLDILPYIEVQNLFVSSIIQRLGDGHEDAVITQIEFGFYSRPENQPQGWYQPCYLFHVSFNDPKLQQDTGGLLVPVPAIDPKLVREPLELPQQPPAEGDPARIFDQSRPPTLPSSAPIFAIVPNVVNSDMLVRRASTLGFQASTFDKTPRGLTVVDPKGTTMLYLDKNGSELFSHTDQLMMEPPGKFQPISDEVAVRFATDWLSHAGGVNMTELGTPLVQHLFHQSFDIQANKMDPPTQDENIVLFKRQLMDPKTQALIPILGEGEFLQVHLDNLGNVVGEHRVWRSIQATNTVAEIRPFAAIQEEFMRRLLSEMGTSPVNIRSAKFGYFARGEGFAQGFLLPAVLFEVEIINPDTGQVVGLRNIPVPASDQQPEPLEDPDALDNPMPELDTRAANDVPALFGDVNGDGRVSTADVAMALQISAGIGDPVSPASFAAADISPAGSPDSHIQIDDALRIARSIYGLEDISNG